MDTVKLVVFDMAGTTVRDKKEVEGCFAKAAAQSGLPVDAQRILSMQGLPKLLVVQTLWKEVIGEDHPDYAGRVERTYRLFREILEHHYMTQPVEPTEGALETFQWLRAHGIRIALTTGFYRKVANIILHQLGWDRGLDDRYMGSEDSVIDLSLTPDETGKGRPHPDMIFKAMEMLGIEDSRYVVNIGDTPSDLLSGKAARCFLSIGVTNGTHSREGLLPFENDGLLDSLKDFPSFLLKKLGKT